MPRESSHLPFPEDKAARIIERAIADAMRDMEAVVLRYARDGRNLDSRLIAQITDQLEALAREYAVQAIRGEWGGMLRTSARAGAKALDGITYRITKDQINAVLNNDRVRIKNLLESGVALVNEIMAAAKVRGSSLAQIASEVHDRVKIGGQDLPWWRAEMIARNELFSTYRMFSKAAADRNGVDLFQMRGPLDDRTTALCAHYVGKVMSAEEWEKVSAKVFQYGLHYGCRHSWDPVRDAESEEVQAIADAMAEQRQRLKEAA